MYQGIIICLEEGKRRRSICLLYKEGSDLCDFCPPNATEFEHQEENTIYFRQRCCGLCGIQVKKESNGKTVALFLFLNTISIIFNCGTIAQIL